MSKLVMVGFSLGPFWHSGNPKDGLLVIQKIDYFVEELPVAPKVDFLTPEALKITGKYL